MSTTKTKPRGRPPTDSVDFKVSLPGNTKPLLDELAALGLYGSTATEVIRRLVLEGIEDKVFNKKVLDSRWSGTKPPPKRK